MNENRVWMGYTQYRKWAYIPLGIIIFLCLGTVYSWSIFRGPLEFQFSTDATKGGLPYMLFLASYAFVMPLSGKLLGQYGPRKVMVVGGMMVGLGWILSGYATNIQMVAATYGVIAGAGVGIVYGGPITVVAKWFPDHKGFAVGTVLLGFGLSPFITAPLSRKLIELYGPLSTFKIFGWIFIFLIPLLSLCFRFPSIEEEKENTRSKTTISEGIQMDVKKMFRQSAYYGLWSCYMIGTLIGLMMIGITGTIGEEVIRLTPQTAATMVAVFSLFNGIGRPLFGWMTDKITPRYTAIISYALLILAAILMLVAKQGSVMLYGIAFSLFWLNLGGWLAIAPATTAIFFGSTHYSQNYGFVFTAYGVGAILGVWLSGIIKDVFGTYLYAFYPVLLLALIGMGLAAFFLKEPRTN